MPYVTLQRRWARVAGISLFLICMGGLFGNDLIIPGDAVATARNIVVHERRFRIGLFSELFMLNADVVLAVALFYVLRPISAPLAFLGALWRFANAIVQGLGVIVSLVALSIITDARYLSAFNASQMAALMRQLLNIHGAALDVGLIFWSAGAAVHSYLLWKSNYIPRILSILYFIVTISIFVSFSTIVILPKVGSVIEIWVLFPDFIVELVVALWFIFRRVTVTELSAFTALGEAA